MTLKSIGYVINHLMIYPLIVSFIIIAATISFSLFAVDNRRVEKIKSSSYDFHKFTLRDIAQILGSSFEDYMVDIINDVYAFNTGMQSASNNKISLVSSITPSSNPSYYVNALSFALEGPENIGIDIPGYDSENNLCVYRPMWFIDRDTIDITTVSDFQQSYQNFIMELPLMYSLYASGKYTTVFSVTRERATTQRKLYSTYPLNGNFDSFVLTLRAGPWFNLATAAFEQSIPVALLDPYYINNNGYVYTACMSVSLSTTSFADINVNCVNYDMQLLIDSLQNVYEADQLSFFVLNSKNYNVIIHPNLQNVTTDQGTVNITQAQYGATATSSSEAVDFTAKLTALSSSLSSSNYYMEYTQDDLLYLLILTQVSVSTGTSQSTSYLVGVTQPKSFIYTYYSSFGDDVVTHARIQLIGVMSILIALSAVYFITGYRIDKSVTNSIKELIKFGKSIDTYFHTESKDFISNKDQAQFSFSTSQDHKVSFASSRELQLIHQNFEQVMDMIHCTKEAQYASSDAEALTGYSQALKIYQKINHAKGLSIVYSNIARLHHQNGRIEEAVVNYQKAKGMIKQEIEKLEKASNDLLLEQHINIKKGGFLRRKATFDQEEKKKIEMTENSLKQMTTEMKVELAERFYEFGQCLIQSGKKKKGNGKKMILEEIKSVFSEVMKHDKSHRDKPYRIIICLLTISSVMLEQDDLDSAVSKLDEAEVILMDYAADYPKKSKESPSNYFIPTGILQQNLMLQRALYYKRSGLAQEAFKLLTDTLEIDIKFDPNIRKRCLLEIKSILKEADLLERAPNVTNLLETYNNKVKDIVIVLDCSQSMGQGTRLRLLLKNVLNLFDNFLGSGDRMGYITFNLNCDTVFALTDKKKNTSQIRKLLEAMPRPSGGTALYTAIYEAIKLVCKAEPKNSSKWIVVLTDGDDDGDSRITHTQIFRRLARSDMNLIIMGLALPQSVTRKMSDLCKATNGGVFVESQSEDKLDEAFNMIISIIYGQEFKSEEITFQL